MDNKELSLDNNGLSIGNIEPNNTIEIHNPIGKKLVLDFNGDTLKTSGDLELDEGAKIFIESLNSFFIKRLEEEREKGRKEQ